MRVRRRVPGARFRGTYAGTHARASKNTTRLELKRIVVVAHAQWLEVAPKNRACWSRAVEARGKGAVHGQG